MTKKKVEVSSDDSAANIGAQNIDNYELPSVGQQPDVAPEVEVEKPGLGELVDLTTIKERLADTLSAEQPGTIAHEINYCVDLFIRGAGTPSELRGLFYRLDCLYAEANDEDSQKINLIREILK